MLIRSALFPHCRGIGGVLSFSRLIHSTPPITPIPNALPNKRMDISSTSPILRPSNSSLVLPPKPARPAPLITQQEIDDFLIPHVYPNGWEVRVLKDSDAPVEEQAGPVITVLTRKYAFKTFKATVAFFNDAVEIIKKEKHHPRSSIGYNQIRVTTWTHKASKSTENDGELVPCQGITAEDLILAMRMDALYMEERHNGAEFAASTFPKTPYQPSNDIDVHKGPTH